MAKLPKTLAHKTFTLEQALAQGMTKYVLGLLVEEGALERVARGIYRASDSDSGADTDEQYRMATLRCGTDSAICLLSALEHYGLTDVIPKKVWILVPHTKRVVGKNLKLVRCRNPQWDKGIVSHKGYAMTSVERTLIESLLYRRIVGSDVALRAIKMALQRKLTTLGKIYDVAKKLGVEHRIRPVIEVLSV